MFSESASQIIVRDAETSDVPTLTAIKADGSQALHRDRLRDARNGYLRYLVVLAGQELIGLACLVFRRPAHWSDANDIDHLPQIVDLHIKESQRGQGYGSQFMRIIERIAAEAGFEQLFLSVEPSDNPQAYLLYQRLGYQQEQTEPYQTVWEFQDSDGNLHRGEAWVVDMMKSLNR
jgi:ribosomal protein S18 acetylase RimI-like enzyme